jgi:CspA family cold shock protein
VIGIVKFFNFEKGFGFITRDDGRPDVFVHVSGLVDRHREIKEGDRVTFELGEHRGRTCAERVEIVG